MLSSEMMVKAYSQLALAMGLDADAVIGAPDKDDTPEAIKENLRALLLRSWAHRDALNVSIESVIKEFFLQQDR